MELIRKTLHNILVIFVIIGVSLTLSIMFVTLLIGDGATTDLVNMITNSAYWSICSVILITVVSFMVALLQE